MTTPPYPVERIVTTAPAPRDLPVIVYIVGRGFSGSTLLDLLISSHSAVASLGEIKMLSASRCAEPGQPDVLEQPCTCGAARVCACSFWQQVDRVLQQRHGLSLGTLDVESRDEDTFVRHNRAVYGAVQEVSGCRFLVDSSKNYKRLKRLLSSGAFDVRVLYLMRHPLGVIHSHVKRGRDWQAEVHTLLRKTMKTRRVLDGVPHRTVHYEHLAAAPRETLAGIMDALGLDLEAQQHVWTAHEHHTIDGNSMRLRRDPEIRLSTDWKRDLTLWQKWQIRWMTLPTRCTGTRLYDRCPPLWELRGFTAWARTRRDEMRATYADRITAIRQLWRP